MAAAVQPSATLAAGAKARQLKTEGKTSYDFSLGEPDFNTPEHICDAAYKAMLDGHTHYTPAAGIAELRSAIARWYKRTYGYEVCPEQVIVSNGAKHSLHNALAATVGPGDEVIIPTPYWVSYSDLVQMTGASYVLVPTTEASGFKMTPAQLKAAITPRSKLVMLNSPSNPDRHRLHAQASSKPSPTSCSKPSSASSATRSTSSSSSATRRRPASRRCGPAWPSARITISGVSKSYAMTGWRMGWAIGPLNVIKAMGNVQSQETSNPSSISQYAAIAALEGDQQCVEKMRKEFEARRDLVCQRLSALPGVRCPIPDGAFYAFFNVVGPLRQDAGRQESHRLAPASVRPPWKRCTSTSCKAPRSAAKGYVRLSFATSREQINGGIDKLAEFLQGNKRPVRSYKCRVLAAHPRISLLTLELRPCLLLKRRGRPPLC